MTRLESRASRRGVISGVFAVAVAVALAVVAQRQGRALATSFSRIGPAALSGSLLATLAGLLASAFCWRALLRSLGSDLPRDQAVRVFFLGQLGKYLPGNVFAVVAQAELARAYGVARSRVVTAGLVFLALLAATGLGTALVLLPLSSPDALHKDRWLFLLLPILVVALHPKVLSALIVRALRVARRAPLEEALRGSDILQATGWALGMWACYGLHLVPLVLAQPHRPVGSLLVLTTGGYALAWTAGLLVVVAPAGAGVREAVLVLVLASVAGSSEVLAVALVSRAVQTLGDLVWALLGYLIGRRR